VPARLTTATGDRYPCDKYQKEEEEPKRRKRKEILH
jgi:hypothetical protein